MNLSSSRDDKSRVKPSEPLRQRADDVLGHLLDQTLTSGLYLVATPIGNLGDISIRALSVLAKADVIYCENPRHSRKLLNHYAVKSELGTYHEHNAGRERPRILASLEARRSVVLISDAGTPLISDPGFKLVRDVQDQGHLVHVVPGPSAPIAALALSGLPTDRFFFEGFLPSKTIQRQKRLAEIAALPATLVLFETAQRLAASLADMADILGARDAALVKEITKIHEAVERGALNELATAFSEADPKGEFVIVIAPPGKDGVDEAKIVMHLRSALNTMSLRDAARQVSDELNVPRNRVYELALEMKRGMKT